jgi:glycosidase
MQTTKTPWFHSTAIYHMLIDRFAGTIIGENGNRFMGGTLKGITQKLDYISGLGFNCIWLSPFYQGVSYHGYHITDFGSVDPHFGSLDDLKALIEAAHQRGIKVMADWVPNHCSSQHPVFIDAQTNRNSRYRNWFKFDRWPDKYRCFLQFNELPKLNLNNPETARYMIDNAKYWLSLGIDAFRIDHAIGPSHTFWQQFKTEMKTDFPHAVFIGEIWAQGIARKHFPTVQFKHKFKRWIAGISQEKLQLEYAGELDGCLDFALYYLLIEAAMRGSDFVNDNQLKARISKHLAKYPPNYYPVVFLDNHDVNRFLYYCRGNTEQLAKAIRLIFDLRIPAAIYYATETGVYNKKSLNAHVPFSDLAVREPFDWENINHEIVIAIKASNKNRI